jgi:hypothetical protein
MKAQASKLVWLERTHTMIIYNALGEALNKIPVFNLDELEVALNMMTCVLGMIPTLAKSRKVDVFIYNLSHKEV